MAVYSMTGFASVQEPLTPPDASPSAWQLAVEVRSVNSRFLDLSLRLPDDLRTHETPLRELLTQRLRRGKVELRVLLEGRGASLPAAPSPALLGHLHALQRQVLESLPDARPLAVADVLRLGGSESAGVPPAETTGPVLLRLVAAVCDQLAQARAREGQRLADMLLDRCSQLRALAHQAQPLVPELVAQQRQRFLDRWRDAMALTDGATLPEAAQDRALSEATAFAIRIDVAEELTRLQSHLDEIEQLLRAGGELGKRLDFLIQELHREANTLGSKSAALALTRISVDMKVLIEQMREQVQNIE